MSRIIETIVTLKDGQMTLETTGAIGSECQAMNKPFLDAMGLKPEDYEETLLPEYHQAVPEAEQERTQEGGGSLDG